MVKTTALSLEYIASIPEVVSVKRMVRGETNRDYSEGKTAHKANKVHSAYTGKGIRVGVISDTASQLSKLVASGDLPKDSSVVNGFDGYSVYGTGSSEGTAMMEVVYDMAPGVSLRFASAGGTCESYADAIYALFDAGCKIIVDDMGFLDDIAFQDGPVSQAVNYVTDHNGIYITCACNFGSYANRYADDPDNPAYAVWQGDFSAFTGTVPVSAGTDYEWLNFGSGLFSNIIADPYVGTDTRVIKPFILQWSDPDGKSANDYDLYLVKLVPSLWGVSYSVISTSCQTQNGKGHPIELVSYDNANGAQALMVRKKKSAEKRMLRLQGMKCKLQIGHEGAIFGHHANSNAITVAAAQCPSNRVFQTSDPVETFSSDGPGYRFFWPDGKAMTKGYVQANAVKIEKPDITAADGVTTASDGFSPFYGTSASAPHVAGIVALMLEANPSLSPAQVKRILRQSVFGTSSWNNLSGCGIVDAQLCVNNAKTATTSYTIKFAANGGTGTMASMTCKQNAIYRLTKNAYKKSGKTFKGWRGSNGKRYDDQVLIFNLALPETVLTLTAVWE